MGTKITKAEFETLPESLKTRFKSEGDSYLLEEEDVEGLKKSKAEILAEKKRVQDELDELKKFKSEHEKKNAEAEEEKLKAAGEFKQLEEKLRARIAEVETQAKEKEAGILNNLKTERLKNLLIEKGVLADRAGYALADVADQFELASDENGFTLKLKNGIGDAKEIDTAIEGLRSKADFLFASKTASGSGASGSQQQGGNGKAITRAQYDANPAAYGSQLAKGELKITD